MKSSKLLIIIALLLPAMCRAEELYSTYAKVSINYILDQPNQITTIDEDGMVSQLPVYSGEDIAYTLEAGIAVPTVHGDTFRLGISWYDILNQGESRSVHRPYRLEPFADYYFDFSHDIYFKVGVGLRAGEQSRFYFKDDKGEKQSLNIRGSTLIDRVTARFALGKQWDGLGVSLEHNSQWFSGKPIDDSWEYQTTSINFSYTF